MEKNATIRWFPNVRRLSGSCFSGSCLFGVYFLGASLFGAFLRAPPCLHADSPVLLDDQFDLPPGFHIYRAAAPKLTGGSYDLTLDADGRLLVGDGQRVRRLDDTDGDGVFDRYQTIAEGLGGRGPQGLLVLDDHLYAVGGDGVQLFSGYRTSASLKPDERLKHEGRLGAPFNTGGDHAAHTLLRGHDGYIYLVSGDGGGVGGRKHITETSSPMLEERVASVFRFSPDGTKWECVASGGRNPPSLGMNYLGELFSFDSDMEWHVDVPFYRPVRLNHWATGADLGWQGVGAYPPYYIDTIPGILDVGRGSPDWGVFYEHVQFPERYRDAFLCCDYRWKSATSGGYNKSGRLVAFHLRRAGATWKAEMSLLAQAKPGGRTPDGKAINFGLVDVDVAPDGSIFVSDHNQGVWRIFYDARENPNVPALGPPPPAGDGLNTLSYPQPSAEWARARLETSPTATWVAHVANATSPRQRLRAIRMAASRFAELQTDDLVAWCNDTAAEVRGQAAWLIGIRGNATEVPLALALLEDSDPFVRRRAAEAFTRLRDSRATEKLIELLAAPERHVRYAAMMALAHRPSAEFLPRTLAQGDLRVAMRGLVAALTRKEPAAAPDVRRVVQRLLAWKPTALEDQLDRLRVLQLTREEIEAVDALRDATQEFLVADFRRTTPAAARDLRWEQVRLLGVFGVKEGFALLLQALEDETDGPTQFHIATALAGIAEGWTEEESQRLARWMASTQTGWFAELEGKGRQFGGFWATTLKRLAERHSAALGLMVDTIVPGSQLATLAFDGLSRRPDADRILIRHYRRAKTDSARQQLLKSMAAIRRSTIAEFLVAEHRSTTDNPALERQLLATLASQPLTTESVGGVFLPKLLAAENAEVAELAAQVVHAHGHAAAAYAEAFNGLKVGERRGRQALDFALLENLSRYGDRSSVFDAALSTLSAKPRPDAGNSAEVIWSSTEQIDGDEAWFSREFTIPAAAAKGTLTITCDNEFTAYVNGTKVGQSQDWEHAVHIDVRSALRAGKNLIAVHGVNRGGPAGLIATLEWETQDEGSGAVSTDSSWLLSKRPSESWQTDGANDGAAWAPSLHVTEPTKNALNAFRSLRPFDAHAEWLAAQEHWQRWYRETYSEAFVARPQKSAKRVPNEVVHKSILDASDLREGDPSKGRHVYLSSGCFACHGGIGERKATLFGPALSGVTLRLNRQELADSLVYPSKQVAERFRATVLVTTTGAIHSGFVTEQSDEFVSITNLENEVTRVPRSQVASLSPQEESLMPGELLNTLSNDQVRDLLAFLASLE